MAAGDGSELAFDGFTDGKRYDAARPDYPSDALEWLVESLHIDEDSHVVDLGAGTGIFTAQLVAYGARVTAVEPTAGMRQVLRERELPGVTVLEGRDVAIPIGAGTVDQVTVAQAFHWFDAPAALGEIRRVLRPGGGLALIWNERDEAVPWVAALSTAMRWPERQPYQVGMDFAPVIAAGGFIDVERRQFRHHQLLDHGGLLDRVRTTSYIAAMGATEREALMSDVAEVVRRLPEPLSLPYVTDTYRAVAPRMPASQPEATR